MIESLLSTEGAPGSTPAQGEGETEEEKEEIQEEGRKRGRREKGRRGGEGEEEGKERKWGRGRGEEVSETKTYPALLCEHILSSRSTAPHNMKLGRTL